MARPTSRAATIRRIARIRAKLAAGGSLVPAWRRALRCYVEQAREMDF